MSSVIFPGQYIIGHHCHLSFHCAIEDDDSVVLTGGFDHLGALSLVTRYNVKGGATSLPGIRRDRHLLFEVEMYLQKGWIMVSGVGSS